VSNHHPFHGSVWRRHGLSIVSISLLVAWILLYRVSDPQTHMGSFFGNAIADWSGVVVIVLGTKWLYELGSAESRRPKGSMPNPWLEKLRDHSLSLFLLVTGAAWVIAFARSDPNSKWGQVIGNIVSEWTQAFGLVILTKRLKEAGSKESKR
jgi:hypothetical protein